MQNVTIILFTLLFLCSCSQITEVGLTRKKNASHPDGDANEKGEWPGCN